MDWGDLNPRPQQQLLRRILLLSKIGAKKENYPNPTRSTLHAP
jgi:hypothetical protein